MPKLSGQTPRGTSLQHASPRGEGVLVDSNAPALEDLTSLLHRLPNAVVLLDREWRITFANEEARKISRLTSADLNNRTHWEMYPETLATPIETLYREVMQTGVSSRLEHHYAPFKVWLDIHVLAMPQGIALHYQDITAQKSAEADSAEAEVQREAIARRLNQVLEVTTDAVVSLDRSWNYTFFNTRAIQLLGRDDLLGKNVWEEYPAAVDSDFSVHFRRCMEAGVPTEFEAYYPAPLERWLSLLCRPSDDGMVVFFRDITERRQSEQLFHQQRGLITFVQQASHTAFWNLDFATGVLSFDVGSYPVFGHPFDQLNTVEQFRAIVHPDDRAEVTANVARAMETGDLVVNDFRVIDPEGKTIWLEARSQTAMVEGRAVGLGGMTIDIGDRKRSEQALASSEQRYRVLAELSPQSLWTGSPDGQITYANQGFLDYLGFTLDDVGGDHWLTAFDPQDRDAVLAAWGLSVTTGTVYDIEARLIEGRTQASRWWWLRGLPLRDEAGSIVNWLGVAVDIHDRRTAAEALHQKQLETERQRAELETLYQTAPIGLALFDPVEFRYLRLNERQAEIVGLPPQEILGRRLTEIAPIPGLYEMFQKVALGIPIINARIEGSVGSRPNDHRYFDVNYFPVFSADGSIRAITAASLEVTTQRKAELALIESEKLAAVGRLASSISHEINNPLEAITNLLYLIASDPTLTEETEEFVEIAQGELARVCQIATQTLRFHRQAVRATKVTAKELVGAVLSLYLGRLTNSGVKVEARYDSVAPILCLENDIRQVLNNLIANAIDAMRHGGRLIVRAHDATRFSTVHPEGQRGVRITIADTGHGMSEAVRMRVFEPFYTTKALNGTGLGLWISSGIIARHDGTIRIKSSEDPVHHGSVFSIFLPHVSDTKIKTELS